MTDNLPTPPDANIPDTPITPEVVPTETAPEAEKPPGFFRSKRDALQTRIVTNEFVSGKIAPRLTGVWAASFAGALFVSLIFLVIILLLQETAYLPTVALPLIVLGARYFSTTFAHTRKHVAIMLASAVSLIPILIVFVINWTPIAQKEQFKTTQPAVVALGLAAVGVIYALVVSHFLTSYAESGRWPRFTVTGCIVPIITVGAVILIAIIPIAILLFFLAALSGMGGGGSPPMTNDEAREATRRGGGYT